MSLEIPSRSERIAAAGAEAIGGPVGRYARVGQRAWVPAAATLSALSSVLVAVGVLRTNHCLQEGWSTPGSLWRMCYSDLPAAANGLPPSSPYSVGQSGETQPVLTAVLTWVIQHLAPGSAGLGRQQWYVAIAAVLVVLFLAVTITALAWMLPTRPWRAAFVGLSPLLVTSSLISFDLFGVALMTVGLAAWVRGHPRAAGALLGAAIMARSFPALVLVAIVLLGWQAGQRAQVRAALAAAGATIAVCLGLAVALGGNPLDPYQAWLGQGATYGSVWLVVDIVGVALPTWLLTTVAVAGLGVALMVGRRLARRANPPTVATLSLLMLAIVMLTGKSNSLQSALWLLPLIAASLLPWRDYLIWVGIELMAFAATWLYVGHGFDSQKSLPAPAYVFFSSLRLLALAVLAWRVFDLEARSRKSSRVD